MKVSMWDIMSKEKSKQKKIVFSEEIDSKIDGLALGFSFIFVGLFLLLVPDYFGNKIAGQIVRWIFVVIGGLGLLVELQKSKPVANIKGFDDLWSGVFLISGWAVIFFIVKNSLWNIAGLFFLIFGLYGACRGSARIIYSVWLNRKKKVNTKGVIASDIILFLTRAISLALVVYQLVKAIQGE